MPHIGGDDGQTKGNRFYVIVRVHSDEFTVSLHMPKTLCSERNNM